MWCRIWAMENEKLVYLLSPVRQVTPNQAREIAEHAEKLNNEGVRLFNPVEDAPQDDETGFNIVMAELSFLHRAAREGGRVDILWNAGGTPSEGSRVDLGMILALELDFNLVNTFNEETPTGPQMGLQIIKEAMAKNLANSPHLREVVFTLEEIRRSSEVIIDWDIEMTGIDQEWQRIYLGLVLGCMAQMPNLKIKLGKLYGIDPVDKKSYIKVIKEIEKNGGVSSV